MCCCIGGRVFDVVVFFFCRQKTAYEVRISDWSSDVCSSDLLPRAVSEADGWAVARDIGALYCEELTLSSHAAIESLFERVGRAAEIGRASCRERVCQYV